MKPDGGGWTERPNDPQSGLVEDLTHGVGLYIPTNASANYNYGN